MAAFYSHQHIEICDTSEECDNLTPTRKVPTTLASICRTTNSESEATGALLIDESDCVSPGALGVEQGRARVGHDGLCEELQRLL